MCGQLRGYQSSTPDAFGPYYNKNFQQLDEIYVEGISITYGAPVLKHIWTYATAIALQYDRYPTSVCPCNSDSALLTPPFVGSDYYCETGSKVNATKPFNEFFPNDPLWDGQQCVGVEAPCCTHPNMPWFVKTLNETTTEDIQLRLCVSGQVSHEETLLQLIKLYVF